MLSSGVLALTSMHFIFGVFSLTMDKECAAKVGNDPKSNIGIVSCNETIPKLTAMLQKCNKAQKGAAEMTPVHLSRYSLYAHSHLKSIAWTTVFNSLFLINS